MVTRAPLSPAVRAPIVRPQFRYRDERGRFRAATPEERFTLDVLDAQAQYYAQRLAGGHEYGVFAGARTGRRFAIRRGAVVGLENRMMIRQVERIADLGSLYLLKELRRTSPVDTGLLRSRWQIVPDAVVNDVPYVFQTEYVNRSSRGYVRRAVRRTLRYMRNNAMPIARQRGRPTQVTIQI